MEPQENKGFFRGLINRISGAESTEALPLPPESEVPESTPVRMPAIHETTAKPGLFERLKSGLKKTKDGLVGRIDRLVLGKKEIDADTLEELEEILITADIGVVTSVELIRTLEQRLKRNELQDGEALRNALKEEILARLVRYAAPLDLTVATPFVMMVNGVNGVGK